ncbi:PLP-dependent aminotransferase family protein [Streptomyces sp. NPDC012600]|uniref:GntR family transcriptional regulator n=1 Tax=Kitasatospora albolonga TaxID=68173 RepID=A0ABC8C058_9ACTN|nr:GntR family transcriptional regulator [Kitasatospora albolonga]
MPLHLSVAISRSAEQSLNAQIRTSICEEIEGGILQPGTRLPSSRQLAADLGVSRSVVVEAYGQLVAEGFLEAARGAGTRVVRHLPREPVVPCLLDSSDVPVARWDLRVSGQGAPAFPHKEWLTAYQRVLRSPGAVPDGYPPLAGVPELRSELSRHLGRLRGVRATPSQVMVTAGFAQGLSLLCADLVASGQRELAVEEPGHPGQRHFVAENGLRPVPVPVDAEGIDVEALAATSARAVLVTPAHQFPVGYTLSASRREALARWARDVDGLVIEDDYDGALWYDRAARPLALQRLAPDHVVYAGTASKVLGAGLRLGWLAGPEQLLHRLLRLRGRQDLGTDAFTQAAFAEFLGSGLFDRHLRRLTETCAARRSALDEAVRRHLPGAAVLGSAAGVHAYVRLPPHTDETAVVGGALRRSVLVRGGGGYRALPRPGDAGLVVGFAHLPKSGVTEAVREVGAALSGR